MNLVRRAVICGSCGQSSEQLNTNAGGESGAPDLDTRPHGLVRSTIAFWMQRCPHCGYCAADISSIHEQAADLIADEAYQRQLTDSRFPPKACEFLAHAMILDRVGQRADAGWTCLHAAWVCDDNGGQGQELARGKAMDHWRNAKLGGEDFAEPELESALATDLLRRMGRFEDALINCNQALDSEDALPPLIEHLLRFEKSLIQRHDTGTYRLSDLPAFQA